MPIDTDYRTKWRVSHRHRGHDVWVHDSDASDEIHGTIVGIHLASCNGCLKCINACPTNVLTQWEHTSIGTVVDPSNEADCILCFVCEVACKTDAIHVQRKGGSQETLESLLRGAE